LKEAKIRNRHQVVSVFTRQHGGLAQNASNKTNIRFRATYFKIAAGKVSPREVDIF
jgi:hypothetical protein